MVLASCATTYHPNDNISGGFSDFQVERGAFRVTFQGNGYSTPHQVEEMALMRAAEMTLERGYSFFQVVLSDANTRSSTYTTPTYSATSGQVRSYGNTASFTARTNTYGGQAVRIDKPSITIGVLCFVERPANDARGVVYDARMLFDSLAPKYLPKK